MTTVLHYEMRNVDARKREIIDSLGLKGSGDQREQMANVACPPQDRVMIADFVINAVEKVMATLDTHFAATMPMLTPEDAAHAYIAATIAEISTVADSIVRQMAMQSFAEMAQIPGGMGVIMESAQAKGLSVSDLMNMLFGRGDEPR